MFDSDFIGDLTIYRRFKNRLENGMARCGKMCRRFAIVIYFLARLRAILHFKEAVELKAPKFMRDKRINLIRRAEGCKRSASYFQARLY